MSTFQKSTHIKLFDSLNDEQKEAVYALDGNSLILAGAGTGKTHTLVCKVINAMKSGVDPESIMLLTFTNKAAKEMMVRVEKYSGFSVSQIFGGTFHHIAVRLIRKYGPLVNFSTDFTIMDRSDQETLIAQIRKDFHLDKDKKFPKKNVLVSLYSFMRNQRENLDFIIYEKYRTFEDIKYDIKKIYEEYVKRKEKSNLYDFDDLLEKFLLLLENKIVFERISKKYKWIFVDEYQDTNKIQHEIIYNLSLNAMGLTVVGDDAQSIYAFRGACFKNILEFPNRFKNVKVFKLEQNYRSTQAILDFSNSVIRNNSMQFQKELISNSQKIGKKPFVISCYSDSEQAYAIIEMIKYKMDNGISLKDMAVFYRAHSQALTLQMCLSQEAIPYRIYSGLKFFEQAHIKDLLCYLKVICNPFDTLAWTRILSTLPSVGKKTISKILLSFPNLDKIDDNKLIHILNTINQKLPAKAKSSFDLITNFLISIVNKDYSVGELIKTIIDSSFFKEYMVSSYDNAEVRLDDLRGVSAFSDNFDSLDVFLSEIVLLTTSEDKTDENEDEVLTLTTIHQAKGLEWDHVFVVWLADGYFPIKRSIDNIDDIEEERRLFYVSVTRAKKELIISFPTTDHRSKNGSVFLRPSRFLEEIEEDLFEYESIT